MRYAALAVGLLILAQGVLGLLAPDRFLSLVSAMQVPPMLYLAAAVRVAVGAALVLGAPASRAPGFFRILGVAIVVGGLLTPFIGIPFARIILGWWTEGGAPVVRGWAVFALALGAYIVYATAPRSRAA